MIAPILEGFSRRTRVQQIIAADLSPRRGMKTCDESIIFAFDRSRGGRPPGVPRCPGLRPEIGKRSARDSGIANLGNPRRGTHST